ncbi:unnamed protein product, partial [Didymodactylos carnosus]
MYTTTSQIEGTDVSSKVSWDTTVEPRNYDQIYHYVLEVLQGCSNMVDAFEREYYQQSVSETLSSLTNNTSQQQQQKSVATLISWSKPLNDLRKASYISEIRNGKLIRDLLKDIRTSVITNTVSDEGVILIKRILDCTTDILYSKIPILAQKMDEITNLMNQYFLSFYQNDNSQDNTDKKKKKKKPDAHVETAFTYEKSRQQHVSQVNRS